MSHTPEHTQETYNQDAAEHAARIGNVNQTNPFGAVRYYGTPGSADYHRVEVLNPQLQTALNWQNQARALGANQGYHRYADFNARRGPINLAGLGPMGRALSPTDLPGVWDGVGGGQNVGGVIGQVEQATFDQGRNLLDPVYQQQEDRLHTRLANQGIDPNSVAGRRTIANLHRQRQQDYNNLSMQSVMAGRQEHGRLFGQGMQQRQMEAGLQGQQFNQLETARQNFLNQQLQARQQELGEANAMFQVGQGPVPQYPQPAQPGVAPVNSLGYQAQQDQNRTSMWGSVLGMLGTLGAGAFMLSDPKAKKDVEQVGGLYRYRYVGEPANAPEHIGVMADEVEQVAPETVRRDKKGRMLLSTAAVQAMLSPQGYRTAPRKKRCCSKCPPGVPCSGKKAA